MDNGLPETKLTSAVFVTARLKSSRLPEKMLSDIEGRPALWYPLNRMVLASLPNLRVVCTTTAAEDRRIVDYAESLRWNSFQGSEEDVLQRYLDAASHFGVDFFVNVDGDDLFCSVEHVDRIIEKYHETDADYICCEGLPFGAAPIGVKVSALRDVCARKGEAETQGWGKYFVQSGLYKVEKIKAEAALNRPDYRITLDYPEDLEFFRAVVRGLNPVGPGELSLSAIAAYLDCHAEVVRMNQKMGDEYWERFNREHGSFSMQTA